MTLFDYVGCSYEDLIIIMEGMKPEFPDYYTFATEKFGSILRNGYDIESLPYHEKIYLKNLGNLIRRRLINLHKEELENKSYVGLTLNEIIGCSKEVLPVLVNELDPSQKYYLALICVFGSNFDKTYVNRGLTIQRLYSLQRGIKLLKLYYMQYVFANYQKEDNNFQKDLITYLPNIHKIVYTSLINKKDIEEIKTSLNITDEDISKIVGEVETFFNNVSKSYYEVFKTNISENEDTLKI